jgi:VCBS repeat-containing protein
MFLQGHRLSIGIGPSGSFGTTSNAPSGFFTDTAHGFTRLGIYADHDGFGQGTLPTFRDATLPGTPEERFNVGYRLTDGGEPTVYSNSDLAGGTPLQTVSITNLSTATQLAAKWTGQDAAGLRVEQTISFNPDDTYLKVTIKLTNVSDQTLFDVRYMRNIDPDQAPAFDTQNHIIEQNPGGALVAAYVPASGDAEGTFPFFYYSRDPRAIVANFGFTNTNPYAPQVTTEVQPEGYTTLDDNALAIAFAGGDLAAGTSTTFTFYLGVAADLGEVIDSIVPDIIDSPVAVDDTLSIVEDRFSLAARATTGNVLANDSDPDEGDVIKVTAVNGSAEALGQVITGEYGTLVLKANGSYTYRLANTDALIAGEQDVEHFTYTIADRQGHTATATLTINITGADLVLSRTGSFKAHRGDDQITGSDGADQFAGRGGNDKLRGEGGADTLWGEAGNDQLLAGDGDDKAVGGTGDDVIRLGTGNDRGWGEDGRDVIWGEAGNDTVDGGAGDDRLVLGDGADEGWGGAGNDRIEGGIGDDRLTGGLGNDRLTGGDGGDHLWGGAGADVLDGGAGADVFSGDTGKDRIILGAGDDTAWGGADSDVFVFAPGTGLDRIKDFQDGDRIELKGLYSSFAQVQQHMKVVGDDVVIDLPGAGNSITIERTGLLDKFDFVF